MGLVEHIHPFLSQLDYRQATTKLSVIGLAYLFFITLFFLSALISSLLTTYTEKLKRSERLFWNLAVTRGAFGIFATIVGIWVLFFDDELIKDVVSAKSPTSYFSISVSTGFFLFECSAILYSDFVYSKSVSILLNLHHWLSLMVFTTLMVLDCCHLIPCIGLILEMSTPFSAICWTMLKTGKSHTLFWKTNQFMLVHTFHLRSVVEFKLWYISYQNWEIIWSTMPLTIFCILYTELFLVTFVMTPYWTYKKTVQMVIPIDFDFEHSEKYKPQNEKAKKNV